MDNFKESAQEETFDIKEFLYKMTGYWVLFVIGIVASFVVAFCVNKWSTRIYEVKTSLLIQDEKSLLDAKFTSGLNVYNNTYKLSNEIGILRSYSLTQRALSKLDFGIGYYTTQQLIQQELYTTCPFKFYLDTASPQPLFIDIYVKVTSPTTFVVDADEKNVSFYNFLAQKFIQKKSTYRLHFTGTIHQKFMQHLFAGRIEPTRTNDLKEFVGNTYFFRIFNEISLVEQFRKFKVIESKNSSIIQVSIEGNNIQKSVDFLNALTHEFLLRGLEKKNQIADNTIRFIDSQLGEVSDSLYFSEKRLQDYRANNTIMNVDFQTQQVFTSLENLQNQRAEFLVKQKYYDYLKSYLLENKDGQDLVAPSSLGIQDAVLNNLINELTRLFGERSELQINTKRDNPLLNSAESRIKTMKGTLLENIQNLMSTNKISLGEIDRRIEDISRRVNKLPETERKLFGFERKFKLNDALYTYLITKRSEVQISKASYMPDNEILDVSREAEFTPISPKTRRNYIIALLLGLGLPVAFILLKDFFNDRMLINEDIEALTDYPILGHVIHSREKTQTVVVDEPLSLPSESLRAIRTNFQFISSEKNSNVILVTSSMMGEGKSFITLNLALSFALNNKKCILINFDMRKPKIHQYLQLTNGIGLSSYLSGNALLDDIIINTAFNNLDVILAGTIPPNPMELIANSNTKVLLDILKKRYEYIFIDSPPIGMVADALLLVKYADVNLYIVRQSFTLKRVFSQLIQNVQKKGITNLNIILNDVQLGRKYQNYSHGYAYTYGYGYAYGYNELKKSEKKKRKIPGEERS
jgi:tyrosine-protein kinase Etk/Wzc